MDISVSDTKITDQFSSLKLSINNYNPMNQKADYNPEKVDKSKLTSKEFDVIMNPEILNKSFIVPDLLFAVAT